MLQMLVRGYFGHAGDNMSMVVSDLSIIIMSETRPDL